MEPPARPAQEPDPTGTSQNEPLVNSPLTHVFRGTLPGGDEVVIERLRDDATERERETFLETARWLEGAGKQPGLFAVLRLDAEELALTALSGVLGNLEDVRALRWDLDRQVSAYRSVLEGVRSLHESGRIHGAICPAVILLDDALEPRLAGVPGAIRAGGRVGHLRQEAWPYASPEARQDKSLARAADIYSLGRVLQFLLTGEVPEELEDTAVSRRSFPDTAPEGLTRIVRKCTAEIVGQRYASMDELLSDLQRYRRSDEVGIAEEVCEVEPPAPVVRPSAPRGQRLSGGSRLRVGVALAGVAMLALGVALAWAMPWQEQVKVIAEIATWAGAALATLLLPAGDRRAWLSRTAWAAAAVALVHLLNPTGFAVIHGSTSAVRSADPKVRASAVRTLASAGLIDFDHLDLGGTDLHRMELAYASFDGSNLDGADLRGSYLTEASLRRASLEGARLEGADLSDARIGDPTDLSGARCDQLTALPPGMGCGEDGVVTEERSEDVGENDETEVE